MDRVVIVLVAALMLVPLAAGMASLTRSISPGAAPLNGLQLALADFRGDGHIQVVAQSDDGNVLVLDPVRGTALARFAPGNAGCTSSCYAFEGVSGPINAPVVADVDKDGTLDIIVADTAAVVARYAFQPGASDVDHFVFAKVWEHRYNVYQSFTTMDATPVVGDLDGDGTLEVVVVTEENGIFAVRPDGSTLWQVNIPGGHASPSIRDLDLDGKPEVVVARDDGIVVALNGANGSTKWTFSAVSYVWPASIPMAPTLTDVNGDGKPDVLFAARDAHDATTFTNDHFVLFAVDSWGHLLWKAQPSWGAPLSHTRPILVSVNGQRAVLGGDWNTIGHKPGNFERVGPGHVFLFDATGHEKWHADLDAAVSDKDLAVADVVGDGTQQVIAPGMQNGLTGLWLLDLATGAKRAFLTTPLPTRSGVAVGNVAGTGTFAMVVAVSDGGAAALQMWEGSQGLSTVFPGWGAIKVPKGSSAAAPPPPPAGAFTATFLPKGNEWWIETTVSSSHPVVAVRASVDGGAPVDLPKQTWGAWARSVHAPSGSIVQLTAVDSAGAAVTSPCYRWTAATVVACSGAPPPPPPSGGFTATFGPKGNEWWVETSVAASSTVASVRATVDGGAPVDLPGTSWGTWARSIHAPSGSVVQFTAVATSGEAASSACYHWVTFTTTPCSGGSTTPPPSSTFSATFAPHNGNEWWEQVKVTGSEPVASVSLRVNGAAWQPMKLQSYGDWTASVHAPAGSSVEFQATSTSGATATSAAFMWPK